MVDIAAKTPGVPRSARHFLGGLRRKSPAPSHAVNRPMDSVQGPDAALPTKCPPVSPQFRPYVRSFTRSAVYTAMVPVMWLAKQVLTAWLRTMGASRHVYESHAGQVAVWDMRGKSDGPVGVLIHGLGGSSAEYFPLLAKMRARCARVVTIDLPGHGHSAPLGNATPVGFTGRHQARDRMIAAVNNAVSAHLGETPARFVGHSLGGFIAAHTVAERLRRGIASKLLMDESDGAPWSAARLVDDRRAFAVGDAASAREVARKTYPLRPLLAWFYTPFLWARLASPEIQYLTHSDLKQPHLLPETLAALPEDTVVVVGKHDKFGTEADIRYLMGHLPGGARLERPETGHGDIADAHPALDAVLDHFLSLP